MALPYTDLQKSRYISRLDVISTKVGRHFPLIPRLHQMYRSPTIVDLLKSHCQQKSHEEGIMRSPIDNPTQKHVDKVVDKSFASDVKNLRFGLSLDNINLFLQSNNTHSTWLILMVIYNLPSFLVTKKFFIQVSILIFGKESPTLKNLDVFIQSLVDELQTLWVGVQAQDFINPPRQRWFNPRSILLWTMLDFPRYGLILSLCIHGYKAYTVCGLATDIRAAKNGNKLDTQQVAKSQKLVYIGGRWWTGRYHPYCKDLGFNGSYNSVVHLFFSVPKRYFVVLTRRRVISEQEGGKLPK